MPPQPEAGFGHHAPLHLDEEVTNILATEQIRHRGSGRGSMAAAEPSHPFVDEPTRSDWAEEVLTRGNRAGGKSRSRPPSPPPGGRSKPPPPPLPSRLSGAMPRVRSDEEVRSVEG